MSSLPIRKCTMRQLKERHPRSRFTPDEDQKLRELALLYGGKKWQVIAEQMPGRNARQCRDRYSNYLVPGFFNGQWSPQEDEILLQKYRVYGPKWSKIMKFLEGRSANAIKNRWNYFMVKQIQTNPSMFDSHEIVKSGPEPNPDLFDDFPLIDDGADIVSPYDLSDLGFRPY